MSVGWFLCALRRQGWGMYIFGHFQIFTNVEIYQSILSSKSPVLKVACPQSHMSSKSPILKVAVLKVACPQSRMSSKSPVLKVACPQSRVLKVAVLKATCPQSPIGVSLINSN